MNIHEFLDIFQSKTGNAAKKSGTSYSACCPAHDDKNPSLSIDEGTDGKILLNCFTGCSVDSICGSLGLEVSDLFKSDTEKQTHARTVYSYKDEQGRELYRKIRIQPGYNGKDKSFYLERTDEHGQTVRNLDGCRKVLYNLPEVLKGIADGTQIFLVEGEKDADKLVAYGLIATTSPESLKWTEEFTEMLTRADVIILYDMDKTGVKRKELLCQSLHNQVKRLRVIDLPGLAYHESHGPDVSDWLARGHTTAELLEIVTKTRDYSPARKKGTIVVVNLGEFLDMQLPEREMLLSPFLPSQGLAMIYAKRGVGKTHAALGIAGAVARGGKFWKWEAPKPRKVLFIDGEMPGAAIQERLHRIAATDAFDALAKANLRLITPDLQDSPMPDLSLKTGRDAIEEFVVDCDLVIIDNISSLFRSGIENEADSWQPAQDWALDLRRRGKSILFVHHAGKGGQQRGTSKKEDILDTVICLKHSPNYRTDQGARFEVVFEKTRNFAGETAMPFQVELCKGEAGLLFWKIEEANVDPEVLAVAELSKQGYTIMEIAEQTGLTKAKVEGRLKKARDLELID